jgi:hypothetical protein
MAGSIHCSFNANKTAETLKFMTRTARTLVISAAMAGLVAGTMTTMTGCKSDQGSNASASDNATAKHDCKGLNSCKGQGGCQTGDMGCKGKNSCKGKGGCKAT